MAKDLDVQVQAFLLRPNEQALPYLFVDASSKVPDDARYVTKAVLVVAGVREDGYWEILGASITIARMRSSGWDCSRTSKNGDSPGSNWSPPMGTPASRRRQRPPSSVHSGRCAGATSKLMV